MATQMIQEIDCSFESLNISANRVKYFNTHYEKVNSKLCDWKCDIQLRVGFANFRAHREILSDASDYFFAMFRHDMLEKKQSVINLQEVGPLGFRCLLDYIYHGHVTIDENTVEDILETARFFHIDWMVTVTCDYLMNSINLYNYLHVVQLADVYCLDAMYPRLFQFLSSNLEDLSKQTEFYEVVTFEFLRDFLDCDIFMEMSEGYLLKVVFDWLAKNPVERDQHAFDLLDKIRYGLLKMEELDNISDSSFSYSKIVKKIEDSKMYIRSVNTQCLYDDEMYCERGAKKTIVTMAACEFFNGTVVLYKDPNGDEMCYLEINASGLDTELEFTAQATLGNFLFVAGGYDADYCSSDRLFRYDPRYRDWFELAPMTRGRVSFALCTSGSELFAIGGINHIIQNDRDNEAILSTVESYSPADNRWSNLPSLPQECYGLAAAFHGNTIYTSGGITSEPADPVPTHYVYSYEINSDEWTPLPSMLHSRYNHAMVAITDRLYAIGGKTSVAIGDVTDCYAIESFDTATHQWTQVINVPPFIGSICPDVGVFGHFIAFLVGPLNSRTLYLCDTRNQTIKEELFCGSGISKVSVLPVAFPRHK